MSASMYPAYPAPSAQALEHHEALLAFMRTDESERIVTSPLEHLCHATLTDPGLLRDELAKIRTRGMPASSKIAREAFASSPRSPLSSRIPRWSDRPSSRITSIAARTPFSVS